MVSLDAAPNGLVAVSCLDNMVKVFDDREQKVTANIQREPAESWAVAFEPGDDPARLAVAGGSSGAVVLYNISKDEDNADKGDADVAATFALPAAADAASKGRFAQSVAFSPDGARLACGSASGVVAVFDVASGKFLHTLEGHAMPVRTVDFSPDGKTLYTGCDDGHVHAYDAEHRSLAAAFPGHASWVLGVDASPDGRALVSCGADGAVKLWDLAQRTCAQTLSDQTAAVWGVRFSPGGGRVAAVGDDKSVSLYDYAA